jgi:DNA (cytosine-5)-methyltransferase 1
MSIDAIGSLCTGYGGLDAALGRLLGLTSAWHTEIDPSASAVLAHRQPTVPNLGDIRLVRWTDIALRVHALAAGFPCQAVSSAGRQLAEDDPRWLWPSTRLAIAGLLPEVVALENVANLVSIRKGEVWRGILDDLVALGYRVAWGVFGACREDVGGCHHRHRVFALARLGGMPGDIRWSGKACGVPRNYKALATPAARDGDGRGEGDGLYWERRLRKDGRTNGAPLGAQLITSLLPTIRTADAEGGRIDCREGRTEGVPLPTALAREVLPTPTARPYGSNQGGAAGRVGPVRHSLESLARVGLLMPTPTVADSRNSRNATAGRSGEESTGHAGWTLSDVAYAMANNPGLLLPTITASAETKGSPNQHDSRGGVTISSAVQPWHFGKFEWAVDRWSGVYGLPPEPLEDGPRAGRRLTAQFPEWMMGIGAGYVTDVIPRNDALRVIGNGVFPLQALSALEELDILLRWSEDLAPEIARDIDLQLELSLGLPVAVSA